MKLSYAVAMPDCRARKMPCFRGDLDPICAQLRVLGYEGAELFARNPRELDQQAIADAIKRHGLAVPDLSTGPASEDGLTVTDPDPSVRQATRERLRDYINIDPRAPGSPPRSAPSPRAPPDPPASRVAEGDVKGT